MDDLCGAQHPSVSEAICNKQPHPYGWHTWDNGFVGGDRKWTGWPGKSYPPPTTLKSPQSRTREQMRGIASRTSREIRKGKP